MVEGRLTVPAGTLQVGDYLPFARRVVVHIEPAADRSRVRVTTRPPAAGGTGQVSTHLWTLATPVIIAVRPVRGL